MGEILSPELIGGRLIRLTDVKLKIFSRNLLQFRVPMVVFVTLVALYTLAPLVIFDHSSTVFPLGETYQNGKIVALGPRPKQIATPLRNMFPYAWGRQDFTGKEWYYQAYPWVCRSHCRKKGYACLLEIE